MEESERSIVDRHDHSEMAVRPALGWIQLGLATFVIVGMVILGFAGRL